MSQRPEIVIDGDGHICEPELVWTEYTRAKFRDRVLQIRTVEGRSHLCIEGHVQLTGAGAGPAEACIPGGMEPGLELSWADILPGSQLRRALRRAVGRGAGGRHRRGRARQLRVAHARVHARSL